MSAAVSVRNRPKEGNRPSQQMTIAELCEELGISRSTFYDWRAKKKAPPCLKLPNGDLRVRRVDFEEWLTALEEGV